MVRCHVCFRHCELSEGSIGFCGARIGLADKVMPSNYGRITSIALDPVEKKPLKHFNPGSKILSVGSYGCNLRCPFCQNSEISWGEEAKEFSDTAEYITPDELAAIALKYRKNGNIGIAFTYNEPLIGYEFVRDTARLAHENGLKNVIVSNGTAELSVLDEISPFIDAMNIDLKCFDPDTYKKVLGGDPFPIRTVTIGCCHIPQFIPQIQFKDHAALYTGQVHPIASFTGRGKRVFINLILIEDLPSIGYKISPSSCNRV